MFSPRSIALAALFALAAACTSRTEPVRKSAPAPLAATLAPEISAGIDAAALAAISALHLPGLSVAVVAKGQLVYARGYGLADLAGQKGVQPETLFRLASIAKTLTATAALQLVEQGKLDLDAPIQKYVPSFPQKPWPITARELLGHLGGIRHYRGDELLSTRHYTDLIAPLAIFENDPLEAEPLTKFIYTSYGFNLLGAALENAGGEPFFNQIKTRILIPAGMASTRAEDLTAPVPMASGYARNHFGMVRLAAPFDVSNKLPSGGLLSTAPDLARFAIALLQGGLLKPASRELMWTSQKLKDGTETRYGMGFGVDTYRGERSVQHSGSQPGVSTHLFLLPKEECAVVLLSNLGDVQLAELARQLADRACFR